MLLIIGVDSSSVLNYFCMKKFFLGILALLQILLGIIFLSQSLFVTTFADVHFDGQSGGTWLSDKMDSSYGSAVVTTDPNDPLPPPTMTTVFTNRVTH